MRFTWHTPVVLGSLGIFALSHAAIADDNSSDSWSAAPVARPASRQSPTAGSFKEDADVRNLTQELLRQAMVEMDGNRFDTARSLARRAAALGARTGFIGVHPEQVIAEIDRRERAAAVVIPAAARDSGRNYKARAIELLDHGIQALDENRFEDAERLARQAAQLNVAWDRYDYRPQSLLDDIRRQRLSVAGRNKVSPVVGSSFVPSPAADPRAPTEWADRTNTPAASSDSYRSNAPAAQPIAQTPVPQPTGASSRLPAEVLLGEAMDDLRAGRDELARRRIEQALGSIAGPQQNAAMPSYGGSMAASANRPVGLSPAGIAYPAAPTPQTFFPVRRDQPNLTPAAPLAGDVALKPMHDPYLGDEAVTTEKSAPGAQAMREAFPVPAAVNAAYLTKSGSQSMDDSPVQKVGFDSSTTPATPSTYIPPKVQTSPDVPPLSSQVGWLEKMSTPIPPQGAPPTSQPYAAMNGQRGFNPAPAAPPVPSDTQWSAGRMPAASASNNPAIANSPEQPQPNLFQKMWGAISGE